MHHYCKQTWIPTYALYYNENYQVEGIKCAKGENFANLFMQ